MAKAVLQGRTLNNLANGSIGVQQGTSYVRTFDESTGIVTATFSDNTNNLNCGYGASLIDINKLKPSTQYTFVVNILQNTIDYTNTDAYFTVYNISSYADQNKAPFLGEATITENKGGVKKFVLTTKDDLSQAVTVTGMSIRAFNATVQYQLMIFEGDLTNEDFLEYKWFPTGFGSVSSPTVTMTTANCMDANKLFDVENVDYSPTAKYHTGQSTRALGAKYPLKANTIYYVSCNDCDISHWLGQYKRFTMGSYNTLDSTEYTTAVNSRAIHQNFGQLAWETFKLKEGVGTDPGLGSMSYDWRNYKITDMPDGYCETVDIAPTVLRTDDQGLISMYSYFSYPNTLNGATNAVNHGKTLYSNICFSEIERRNVPYQETVIQTPSNLVLRSRLDANGMPYAMDTLDLKNGTVTRNNYQFDFDREQLLTQQFSFATRPTPLAAGYYWFTSSNCVAPNNVSCFNHSMCSNSNVPVTRQYDVLGGYFTSTCDVAVCCNATLGNSATNIAIGIRQDLLSGVIGNAEAGVALTSAQAQSVYDALAQYKQFSAIFELTVPVVETINLSDQPKPYFYEHGNIHFSSAQVLPTMKYQPQSSNTTPLLVAKDKQYTLFTTSKINNQQFTFNNTSFSSLTQKPMLITAPSDASEFKYRGELSNLVILPGDHTKTPSLPYFTGTKHVEGATIRTIKNENLFDISTFRDNLVIDTNATSKGLLGGFEPNTQYSISWDYLVAPVGTYTWFGVYLNEDKYNMTGFANCQTLVSADNRKGSGDILYHGESGTVRFQTVTSDSKGRIGFGCYFGWGSGRLDEFEKFAVTMQIKKGANNYLPYLPHESTVTSLPSEVVLRGITDDICDTLDLFTGQLTTNIEVMTPEQIVAFTYLTTFIPNSILIMIK